MSDILVLIMIKSTSININNEIGVTGMTKSDDVGIKPFKQVYGKNWEEIVELYCISPRML